MHRKLLQVCLAISFIIGGLFSTLWAAEVAPPPAVADSLLGDADGDGVVNSIDAFLLLQFSAGIIGIGSPYREKEDVNHDGHVDAIDAVHILQFHAGLLKSLDAATGIEGGT